MAKVLRPNMTQAPGQGGRIDTLKDWGNSTVYGKNDIDSIQDPTNASDKHEITSIPSPFARIALVKEAFEKVASSGNLDGAIDNNGQVIPTIYHKMVSDALDVGQLFFNYSNFSGKLDIVVWDRTQDLASLQQTHRIVGTALDMYLQQDAAAFNFNNLTQIFLLRYKGPGAKTQMDIIGATSPRTLFFSSANDFSHISQHLPFGNGDYPFDGAYCPLYKRDFAYVQYLFALSKNYATFANEFAEFYSYLQANFQKLTDAQQQVIIGLNAASLNQYNSIQVNGNTVSVYGNNNVVLHCQAPADPVTSDFVINSAVYKGTQQPLVLPNAQGTTYTTLTYTTGKWTNTNCAPHLDATELRNRILPQTAQQYPYLTISDFLEDYIICMPYELNDIDCYSAGYKLAQGNQGNPCSFALPVTDKFFKYFTVNDLLGDVGNKKMIELSPIAGGVKVTLRIPIKGNGAIQCVEYCRNYTKNLQANAANNQGGINEVTFGMMMLPLAHVDKVRVGLFNKDNKPTQLNFFEDGKPIQSNYRERRQGSQNDCSVGACLVQDKFNWIQVLNNAVKNVLVPLYSNQLNGTNTFKFAVDFGTTNTHIEYSLNGGPANPFDITKADVQVKRLHKDYDDDKDIEDAILNNFIPDRIGDGYNFPIRTIFSESNSINFNQQIDALVDGNIPFRYGRNSIPSYNNTAYELKWESNQTNQQRLKLYIETICILLRNKVLLNQGDLKKTQIVWFYPTSMMQAHVAKLEAIWKDAYKMYFDPNFDPNAPSGNVISVSEAKAPCTYYRNRAGAANDVATIDIGGGTTDIYVMQGGQPEMQTSFRFGANSIFGDGYNSNPSLNGYVQKYCQQLTVALEKNNLSEPIAALQDIIAKRANSAEICSFLFGLKELKPNVPALDFNEVLSNDGKLKYPILIFHSALVYFLALQLKAKGINKPNTLAFSGNGSKTLDILAANITLLTPLFQKIIEDVYNEHYSATAGFSVIKVSFPKTVTCKGGMFINTSDFDEVQTLKKSLLGFDKTTFAGKLSYNDVKQDEGVRNGLIQQVESFIDYIFKLIPLYQNKLGIDLTIKDQAQALCKQQLDNYLTDGIDKRITDVQNWGGNGIVDETLFFYPFVGMLNNLAFKL